MFCAFVAHTPDCFSIFLQELLLVLGVADFSVEQNIQDLIELRDDHLVIHEMCEVGRTEGHLFETIVVLFELFLQNATFNIHVPLYLLQEQHLLSWLFQYPTPDQQRI